MDKKYERGQYVEFPPLNAMELNKWTDKILKTKTLMENEKRGKPTQIKNKIDEEKRKRIKKNFRKSKTTSLRKFVWAFDKELNFCSYEKFIDRFWDQKTLMDSGVKFSKDNNILKMLAQKGYIKVTESILINNGWKFKSRKRYYVCYEKHEEFIDFANNYLLPKLKKCQFQKKNIKE